MKDRYRTADNSVVGHLPPLRLGASGTRSTDHPGLADPGFQKPTHKQGMDSKQSSGQWMRFVVFNART